jgi:hypothetical protein
MVFSIHTGKQGLPMAMRPQAPPTPKKPRNMFGGDGWAMEDYTKPKGTWSDMLSQIGGKMQDLDGTMGSNNFDKALSAMQQRQAEDKASFDEAQKRKMMEAAAGGDQRALAMMDPIGARNFEYQQSRNAAEDKYRDRVYGDGRTDRKDDVAFRDKQYTRVGEQFDATMGQRGEFHDDDMALGHARLNADRDAAAAKAAAGVKFGVTPVYGRDASGNRVLIQTSDTGEINQAELPEGVTLEDDRYKSSQRALGTAEGKKAAYQTEAGQAVIAAQDKADQLIANIDQAIEQSDFWNTGITGKAVWSSDFNATLDSIGANAMLSELLNLKRQGGTLGALSEGEGNALRAAAVNITKSQSEAQLDANLKAYRLQVQRTVDLLKQAYEADYANGAYEQAQPSQGGAAPQSPQYEQTATNSQTGQKIGFRNGQWEPIQ